VEIDIHRQTTMAATITWPAPCKSAINQVVPGLLAALSDYLLLNNGEEPPAPQSEQEPEEQEESEPKEQFTDLGALDYLISIAPEYASGYAMASMAASKLGMPLLAGILGKQLHDHSVKNLVCSAAVRHDLTSAPDAEQLPRLPRLLPLLGGMRDCCSLSLRVFVRDWKHYTGESNPSPENMRSVINALTELTDWTSVAHTLGMMRENPVVGKALLGMALDQKRDAYIISVSLEVLTYLEIASMIVERDHLSNDEKEGYLDSTIGMQSGHGAERDMNMSQGSLGSYESGE